MRQWMLYGRVAVSYSHQVPEVAVIAVQNRCSHDELFLVLVGIVYRMRVQIDPTPRSRCLSIRLQWRRKSFDNQSMTKKLLPTVRHTQKKTKQQQCFKKEGKRILAWSLKKSSTFSSQNAQCSFEASKTRFLKVQGEKDRRRTTSSRSRPTGDHLKQLFLSSITKFYDPLKVKEAVAKTDSSFHKFQRQNHTFFLTDKRTPSFIA